ncbi:MULTISPECIES: hypothetical protein [unclassified Paracoccus (in: a-proteobacteria)]|uniref:hypothetical protein n=1 Tax=unclassified Paracoccus (in: a-proteobacteria) TaxID=2688777 RepID=UPI0012B22AA7|nr:MULTISPECIES: hypothetical protein [unclassified Paracoccus (in: a-proteobacteria)]UXU74833.1 hypothetical protein GB879_013215 [Paracoccus sp. SMMA_5]UXU80731.1 hypothetical protein GB880_013210 [Paracoccus sp. SMMA_5_TC]
MRWSNVQANWSAFYEAITEKWPEVDEDDLDEIDGDQRAFIRYIARVTGQDIDEAKDEIREWLAGEIPSDVVMDPIHDGHSIALSAKYVGEGEDEYADDARFGDDDEDAADLDEAPGR